MMIQAYRKPFITVTAALARKALCYELFLVRTVMLGDFKKLFVS
ncbi:MAG: hypothetical protein N2Z65_02790 [Clostridiales bacterium]|nr:hypothetical protein [Clostridiales bacterium]